VFNELWFDIQLINTGKETAEVTLNFTWAVRASLAWDNFFFSFSDHMRINIIGLFTLNLERIYVFPVSATFLA
jgi:hypothetical protein